MALQSNSARKQESGKKGESKLNSKQPCLVLTSCLALALVMATTGCDTIARSQGKFPIVSSFGEDAIGEQGYIADKRMWISVPDKTGKVDEDKPVPLIKIGYRDPWNGKLAITGRPKPDGENRQSQQSYYMIVDVTNAVRYPRMGAKDESDYQAKLNVLAETLVLAADWNGEVYWRHLTTFLETYKSVNAASKALIGSSIAASFISPVVGASLAGAGLASDTFIGEYTSSLNVDEYAAMRDAASTYRQVLKGKIFAKANSAKPDSDGVSEVIKLAYDYAFTYSIKGAIYAATQQNEELASLIITGESEWAPYLADQIVKHKELQLRQGKITDPAEIKQTEEFIQAYKSKEQLQAENEKIKQQEEAEIEALERQKRKLELQKNIEALQKADDA